MSARLAVVLLTVWSLWSLHSRALIGCWARVTVDSIVVPEAVMAREHSDTIAASWASTSYTTAAPPTTISAMSGHQSNHHHQQQQQQHYNQSEERTANSNRDESQLKFDCIFRYDITQDKNLIVKWYFGDNEPELIYRWIPELRKLYVAPRMRPHIEAPPGDSLEARGFRLTRALKSLAGKYTCTVTSVINDDSKSKRMMVYVLPRTFRFNVTRTIINANLAAQRDIAYKRDKLLQQALPLHTNNIANANNNANSNINNNNNNNNLDSHRPSANPSAARIVVNPIMDAQKAVSSASVSSPVTTIMPQFYSTIDYVNVNHMPPLQSPWSPQQQSPLPTRVGTLPNQAGVVNDPQHYHAVQGNSQAMTSNPNSAYNRIYGNHKMWQLASSQPPANVPKISDKQASVGARLTCDIDDVFPVPEVSIYRLAKLDGSYPEKLAKFETKIDKDNVTGSYHVQVTSIIDDQDLIRKYGQQQTSYFQCLIALPNLESTRYDSKRTIVYTPDIDSNMIGRSEDLTSSPDVTSSSGQLSCHVVLPLLMPVIFALTLTRPNHGDLLI